MRRTWMLALLLLAGILAGFATPAEEPKEKIARVSLVQGDTAYQRGDDEDWNALGANTPLMTGDSLYAAEDGRAEIDLGHGNLARLDTSTALDIVNLSSEITQLGLSQGYINMRVRDIPMDHTVEVATPLASATLWEPGLYRVDVDKDGVRFGVVTGSLSVILDGEQLDVQEGELLELQGGDNSTYGYSRLPAGSAFDRWSEERDTRHQKSTSSQYVHNAVMGYDDLDDSGSWSQDPTYGNVWRPARVAADWAPYQTGNWVWQDPYGWTWVSYEPWGWAPYHYGRWVYAGNSWGWVPPPPVGYRPPPAVVNIQPVYAPALVAFVGGSNWSVGVSVGGGGCMGWVPLAPADPYYYPWQPYPHGHHVTYQNITVINSVTVVNYNNFGRGPVHRVMVGPDVIRRAPVMGGVVVGITPNRHSLAPYPGMRVPPRAIPNRAVRDRGFVVRSVPPPRPVSFNKKVAEIQKTGKPYARPVAMDGNVGKPYKPGMKAPEGVKVRPALGREEGGPKQPKLKAKPGQEARPPKAIERDVVKPKERPNKQKDQPALGGPGGEQPRPDNPAKKDKPDRPEKQKDQPGVGGPGGEQANPNKPWKKDKPDRPEKQKDQPGVGGPGGEQANPNKPWKKDKPDRPEKQKDQPGVGGPGGEQANPNKPWKQDKPTRPEKQKDQPGMGGPGGEQANPNKPSKQDKPTRPEKQKDQPGVGGPGGEQANPNKPWKQDKPTRPEKQKDQPGMGGPGGEQPKPEKPKKQKEFQPSEQPGYGQPEKPKKQKEFQPSEQPGYGQPEKPKKQKEFQPPEQPNYQKPEKPNRPEGGQVKPDKPNKPEGGQVKPPKPANPEPAPPPNPEKKKKKDKDKDKDN